MLTKITYVAKVVKPASAGVYLSTLAVFAGIPFALIVIILVGTCSSTGENLLPEQMGLAQNADPTIVAWPFDIVYWGALKLPRIEKEQPEIIEIGSSRGQVLRSAMFKPYRFYNASLTAWTLDQEIEMTRRVTEISKPRVIVIGLDYFMFTDRYSNDVVGRDMRFKNGWNYLLRSHLNALKMFWQEPTLLWTSLDAWYEGHRMAASSLRLLGLSAIRDNAGFRFDGSMLMPRSRYSENEQKLTINKGIIDAAPAGPAIDKSQSLALERLAELCRIRGVKVVAIQFPMAKSTIDVLNDDPAYKYYSGVWREFQSQAMHKKLDELGITFFDLSQSAVPTDPFNFMDAAHLTESGMTVAMEALARDPRFQSIFPALDPERLKRDREAALAAGDKYEVYGNAF